MTAIAHCGACALLAVSRAICVVEFRILGALNLLSADGHELKVILAQPKRVALLAYLAAATPRRLHRRDSLIALFWPELDQEHARAALRQALHGLRQELGEGMLVSRGDEEVGLDEERLRCDVVEFERATKEGRLADALELYRGELLEGFFIRGAVGFEQWLEDERARLRSVALRSATSLAEQRRAGGDLTESAHWTRRALRIAPFDEPTLRRLIQTLDRLGDRAGALDVYAAFTQRLKAELEADPAPETATLASSIRERKITLPTAQEPTPNETPRTMPVARSRRPRFGLAVGLLGLAVVVPPLSLRTRATPSLNAKRVLVVPFTNRTGDTTLNPLANLAADWITRGLASTEV